MSEGKLGAIETLYGQRKNFIVVGLTGYTSTGCSRLAEIMCDKQFHTLTRNPEIFRLAEPATVLNTDMTGERLIENHLHISRHIFKRKYTICHNFIKENYEPFVKISYSRAAWLYTLLFLAEKTDLTEDSLKKTIAEILKDKYQASTTDRDKDYKQLLPQEEINDRVSIILSNYPDWKVLSQTFNQLNQLKKNEKKDEFREELANQLIRTKELDRNNVSAFNRFLDNLVVSLANLDYYRLSFFYHRLSYQIRKSGDPTLPYNEVFKQKAEHTENVYNIIQLINRAIKGWRSINKEGGCRVVIDRLRNSMEAHYMKERYSAFYLVAVHDESHARQRLRGKVERRYSSYADILKNRQLIDLQVEKIYRLGEVEAINKDVEKGTFASPNVAQCVSDAEIHIANVDESELTPDVLSFASIAEQWMKFASLILHPGLITPSSEERCMVVAYTAKFNSGCLSRQVGAVITNSAHSIRTIGWNDVPYGQISCSLRELYDFAVEGENYAVKYSHSKFELSPKPYYGKTGFAEAIRIDYDTLHKMQSFMGMKGLPFSYCFKTLHNRYEGEKNQVFTRSLHAEENAMLQMVRFGGEGLENGIIYVTASPCDLCSKKLYQIGVRKIVYIDEYPGISRENIIASGYRRPALKQFQGAYGTTYYKLYQPLMAYKDEIELRTENNARRFKSVEVLYHEIFRKLKLDTSILDKKLITQEDIDKVLEKLPEQENVK